jgi:uncharacterized protein (DUF1800 family)
MVLIAFRHGVFAAGLIALSLPAGSRQQEPTAWDERAVEHLMNRAGFGARQAEIEAGVRMGREAFVDALLDGAGEEPEPFFVTEVDRRASEEGRPMDRGALLELRREARREDRRQIVQYAGWWVEQMRSGTHPLRERMTLFWHGHFTSSMTDVKSSVAMIRQNELLRTHALGSFRELLAGILRDPAMLTYLNNNSNKKDRPNENLARELMELFCLGEGNYTEQDVKEAARALTGWHVRRGEFRINRRQHDRGPKTVLGVTGKLDGDDLVDVLLAQDACARWIAGRLIAYFEGVEPDAERLEAYAGFLRENDYHVGPMLARLFRDPDFYRAEVVGTRIAGPIDYIVGASRRLGVRTPPAIPVAAAALLGQQLFGPPNVKGWDGGKAWISTSTVLLRGNLAGMLVGVVSFEDLMTSDALEFPLDADDEWDEGDEGDEGVEGMGLDAEMQADAPPRKNPALAGLRLLDRVGWRPFVNLSARCRRAGAKTDEEIVAFLGRDLLAVPLPEEGRAALVELLRTERAPAATESAATEPAGERPRLRFRRATSDELALRRLAHVILSLPEAQLN